MDDSGTDEEIPLPNVKTAILSKAQYVSFCLSDSVVKVQGQTTTEAAWYNIIIHIRFREMQGSNDSGRFGAQA